MKFTGKQAIVTGAGSGIGAALCRALVAAGADVVCTDVDGAAAARTAESLDGPGSVGSPIGAYWGDGQGGCAWSGVIAGSDARACGPRRRCWPPRCSAAAAC